MIINVFRKSLVIGIIILFFGAVVIQGNSEILEKRLNLNSFSPDYVWVDDDFDENTPGWGYDHFDNIQEGIYNVSESGTVYVYNGIYHEKLVVFKTINLIGEDKNSTIIDGESLNGFIVFISTDFVNLSGFTIRSHPFQTIGIFLENSNQNIISENIITYNYHGIELQGSNFNIISGNNLIDNNNSGVWLRYDSYNNLVYHNNFINNTWGDNNNANDECNNSWYNKSLKEGNYWDDYTGEDIDGDGVGDTPYSIPRGDNEDKYPFICPGGWIKYPPNKPTINGPTSGRPGEKYEYTFVAIDPDGDDISYFVDWGDDTSSGWSDFGESGKKISYKHTWSEEGTFTIKAKAKDIHGAESDWSEFEILIAKSRAVILNSWFQWFIQQFPILHRLLSLLRVNL